MLKNEKNVAAGNWYGLRGVITGFIEVHNSGSNMITWPGQYPASNKMLLSDEKEDLIFDINPTALPLEYNKSKPVIHQTLLYC